MKSLVQGLSPLRIRELLSTKNIMISARNWQEFRKLASLKETTQSNLLGKVVTKPIRSEAHFCSSQKALCEGGTVEKRSNFSS